MSFVALYLVQFKGVYFSFCPDPRGRGKKKYWLAGNYLLRKNVNIRGGRKTVKRGKCTLYLVGIYRVVPDIRPFLLAVYPAKSASGTTLEKYDY